MGEVNEEIRRSKSRLEGFKEGEWRRSRRDAWNGRELSYDFCGSGHSGLPLLVLKYGGGACWRAMRVDVSRG